MTDLYVLRSSENTKPRYLEFPVVERRVLSIPDSNNGDYGGKRVRFDLASVANTGKLLNWQSNSTCVVFPVQLVVTRALDSLNDVTASTALASLKNGNHCFVHGFTTTLSNMDVTTYTPFLPGKISYELATNYDADDVKRAEKLGMYWENGEDYIFNSAVSANGIIGCSNTQTTGARANLARKRRCSAVADVKNTADAHASFYLAPADSFAEQQVDSVVSTLTTQTFNINVRIEMSQLHDFFKQCPISKNGLYSLEFHINTCKMAAVISGALGAKLYTSVELARVLDIIQSNLGLWTTIRRCLLPVLLLE